MKNERLRFTTESTEDTEEGVENVILLVISAQSLGI
jgi:hypothetical protein